MNFLLTKTEKWCKHYKMFSLGSLDFMSFWELLFIEKGEVENGPLFTISLWCSSFFHYWQNRKSFGANLSQAFKLWCPMAHSWLPIAPKMPIALKASMHWEKVGGQKAARWKKTLSISKQERKKPSLSKQKRNHFHFPEKFLFVKNA